MHFREEQVTTGKNRYFRGKTGTSGKNTYFREKEKKNLKGKNQVLQGNTST